MDMKNKDKYSQAFKKKAVKLALHKGLTPASKEFKVSKALLRLCLSNVLY